MAPVKACSVAALVVLHLADHVVDGQPGHDRRLGVPHAVQHVALSARPHVGRTSVGDDLGHGRVLVRVPVRGIERIVNLGLGELQVAAGHAEQGAVIRAAAPAFIHEGIGPAGRFEAKVR